MLVPAVWSGIVLLTGGQDVTETVWRGPGTIHATIGGNVILRNNRGFGVWVRSDHDPTLTQQGTSVIDGTISKAVVDTPDLTAFSSLPPCDPAAPEPDCIVPAGLAFEAVTAQVDTINMTVSDVIAATDAAATPFTPLCRGIDIRPSGGNVSLLLVNNTLANSDLEGLLNGGVGGGVLQVYNNVLWNNYLGGPPGDPNFPDFNGFPADTNFDYNTAETFPTASGFPEGYGQPSFQNMKTDPSLDNTFHLVTGSQVRDAGDDNKPGIPLEDVDGEDRIKDVVPNTMNDIDLGADERQIP